MDKPLLTKRLNARAAQRESEDSGIEDSKGEDLTSGVANDVVNGPGDDTVSDDVMADDVTMSHAAGQHVNVYVQLKDQPSFTALQSRVYKRIRKSSWLELYGRDWFDLLMGIPLFATGLYIVSLRQGVLLSLLGYYIMGCVYALWANRGAHLSVHCSLGCSSAVNAVVGRFFIDFTGGISFDLGYDSHINFHHPHTNIIKLGDSEMWKRPFLPAFIYMFLAPWSVPWISPIMSVMELTQKKQFRAMFLFVILFTLGATFYVSLLMWAAQLPLYQALPLTFLYRGSMSVPYIHTNIFQHIGLPMYAQDARPLRIYQMSTGVLNLERNPLLDYLFGHSLISCHVEHHLFPKLSDSMCLAVKPVVRDYLLSHGLPYNEASYFERLVTFTRDYNRLMVHAPPITHFIGIH